MSVDKWNIFNLLSEDQRSRIRIFAVLGANGNEAIFVTDDDEAFGFGTNYSFCLGIGDYGSTLEPRKIESLCGQKVKAISFGASPHVMAITGDGSVYAWGHNGHSQLGNGTQCLSSVPVLAGTGSGMRNVMRVACGSFHTLALTADGEGLTPVHNAPVLSNFLCELSSVQHPIIKKSARGHGACAVYYSSDFVTIARFIVITRFSSCEFTSRSVNRLPYMEARGRNVLPAVDLGCSVYNVFAWGQNSCGQIGSGCLANQAHPRKVTACIGAFKAVDIACSQSSSFAVLENGEIYAWGYNGNGQLGSGNAINQATPSRCAALAGIIVIRVVCGYAHILALTDQGHIYAWGANTYGQLGNGTKLNSSVPVRIGADLGRFTDIAAVHAASISAAVTDRGKVYMWGQVRGQFVTVPLESPFDNLDDVFACCSHPSITFRAITTKKNLLKDLVAASFDDENTADIRFVTFDVPDRPIWCHKSILRIRCLYFQKMFAEPWNDREKEMITVQDYPYTVYYAFLKYLYTETVKLGTDEALQLLDLANAYCEEHLMHDCTNLIKHGVGSGNAAFIYDYALRYNAKELEDYCFRYMLNHMTEITQTDTFLKLDETTMKNFITKASQNGAFRT